MVGCGGSPAAPAAPSTPYVPPLPKANIIRTNNPETGKSGTIYRSGLVEGWGKNTGTGCANNIAFELTAYEYGGGTYETRGPQLDNLTGSYSGTVYSGDTFKVDGWAYGLQDAYRKSGYANNFSWLVRITFTWTDIACP